MKNLDDLECDLIILHRVALATLVTCLAAEKYLTERLGKVHSITVDYRIKFLIPAMEKEREAQKNAEKVYEKLINTHAPDGVGDKLPF